MTNRVKIESIFARRAEIEWFLIEKCIEDTGLLESIINDYIYSLNERKLVELEDFLTNNFGDD